ncbi:MAG: elongation factor 4 [Acidobacteria bacterium]|uniref:Elongation factor 4 n=1 Tax=Candidatus Polarisedimenticola svalbardensis TaxID=2886004 RepID=A0A8J7C3F5_9BACT|nr:elongation factor 4 [Candidatus Polarisedimenticola svalbardensis]
MNIRNFSIIAHIDHGKTTLSDRLMEATGAISDREKHDQMLDTMDLERERGITIKSHAVTLRYKADDGQTYQLNLIDTPGHVDFNYEVSRSLAACEGALLVVDASQGVEAQTLANTYLAVDNDLEVIPVLNKIDLPNAEPDRIAEQIEEIIGLDATHAVHASAKAGIGIREILEAVVSQVPPPSGSLDAPLKALIFDSWYDPYRGVVMLVRVMDGSLATGMKIRLMNTGGRYEIEELGAFAPKPVVRTSLSVGEVGFIIAGVKIISDCQIGDTVTSDAEPAAEPCTGFEEVKPMVFAGLYPTDADQYEGLRDAMEKMRLNDASFSFEPESSTALGFGFRCGFLGLLHMEIIQERLEREFDLDLLTTAPGVPYQVTTTSGEELEIHNPSLLPERGSIATVREPVIDSTIITPPEYLGNIMKLCEDRRGVQKKLSYLAKARVLLEYELPLNEVVLDFYDKLKSGTRGYASLDYRLAGFREGPLVKLDLLVNGSPVDALSLICHRDKAEQKGRNLATRMKELIPRQMFEVVVQAAIGGKILCRETIRPLGKNVLAKCYGGDITRKRKLLEKQKEGKRRMKRVGRVDIPQDAFLAILKVD